MIFEIQSFSKFANFYYKFVEEFFETEQILKNMTNKE